MAQALLPWRGSQLIREKLATVKQIRSLVQKNNSLGQVTFYHEYFWLLDLWDARLCAFKDPGE